MGRTKAQAAKVSATKKDIKEKEKSSSEEEEEELAPKKNVKSSNEKSKP